MEKAPRISGCQTPPKGGCQLLNMGAGDSSLSRRVMYSRDCLWSQFSQGSPGERRGGRSAQLSTVSPSWTPEQPVPCS